MADRSAAPVVAAPARSTGPPPAAEVTRAGRVWRTELRALLELAGLVGLVITQPLLDVLGRSPDFFLFHRAGRGEVVALLLLVTVLPTVLLAGLGALARWAGRAVGRRTGRRPPVRGHTLLVGLLVAALAVQVGRHLLPLRGTPLLLVAVAVGALGGLARHHWSRVGQLLRAAAIGPPVFVAIFVLVSPAAAVLLPAGNSGGRGGAATGPGEHPPVVMLILDELPLASLLGPDGRIDAVRFPHFAELAAGSTWYPDATGVSGWTPYALPAMLTGRYPSRDVAPHYSQYPENLFTAFGGSYQIRAEESIARLCPPSRCGDRADVGRSGLPTLLRETGELLGRIAAPSESTVRPEEAYREPTRAEAELDTAEPVPVDPRFRWDRLDENQPARFSRFVDGLRPSERPTLHFLHLLMPHSPWTYLPSGARYAEPPAMPNDGPGWVELAQQRHLEQLGYTDRLVGETLRRLRATGLYDQALLVVTADHGLSFTPGAQGRGTESVRRAPGEVLWVPMFVKAPGQSTARVDPRNWEHVDLLPTVAELARIRLPWRVDGIAAGQAPRERTDKRFHVEPGTPLVVPRSRPAAPTRPPPSPLVGTPVTAHPVVDGGGTVRVQNLAAFAAVDPASGRLPALVWGTAPASVPDGTRLAVAVNGRIGAVAPVNAPDVAGRRFAALLSDDSLFQAGANRLELFRVDADGTLRRLGLS